MGGALDSSMVSRLCSRRAGMREDGDHEATGGAAVGKPERRSPKNSMSGKMSHETKAQSTAEGARMPLELGLWRVDGP